MTIAVSSVQPNRESTHFTLRYRLSNFVGGPLFENGFYSSSLGLTLRRNNGAKRSVCVYIRSKCYTVLPAVYYATSNSNIQIYAKINRWAGRAQLSYLYRQ